MVLSVTTGPAALVLRRSYKRLVRTADTVAIGLILNRDGRRQIILRKAFFDLARYATPVVVAERGDLTYYVSTRDRVVSRQTFAAGAYDEEVMANALALLQRYGHSLRGRTFVDIGANLGTSTLPALIRFGARDALAVEPEPHNFELLRCNVIANGLEDRVRTVCAAASDTTGTGQLGLSRWNSGDHRVWIQHESVPPDQSTGRETINVDVRTLDDLLDEQNIDLSQIGVVWMDCQGHEGQVLKGAERLMASTVPVITEYWPYGLRLAGGLELFHTLVARSYDLVIDVRKLASGEAESHMPASEVRSLVGRYTGREFTDLILLKVDTGTR